MRYLSLLAFFFIGCMTEPSAPDPWTTRENETFLLPPGHVWTGCGPDNPTFEDFVFEVESTGPVDIHILWTSESLDDYADGKDFAEYKDYRAGSVVKYSKTGRVHTWGCPMVSNRSAVSVQVKAKYRFKLVGAGDAD